MLKKKILVNSGLTEAMVRSGFETPEEIKERIAKRQALINKVDRENAIKKSHENINKPKNTSAIPKKENTALNYLQTYGGNAKKESEDEIEARLDREFEKEEKEEKEGRLIKFPEQETVSEDDFPILKDYGRNLYEKYHENLKKFKDNPEKLKKLNEKAIYAIGTFLTEFYKLAGTNVQPSKRIVSLYNIFDGEDKYVQDWMRSFLKEHLDEETPSSTSWQKHGFNFKGSKKKLAHPEKLQGDFATAETASGKEKDEFQKLFQILLDKKVDDKEYLAKLNLLFAKMDSKTFGASGSKARGDWVNEGRFLNRHRINWDIKDHFEENIELNKLVAKFGEKAKIIDLEKFLEPKNIEELKALGIQGAFSLIKDAALKEKSTLGGYAKFFKKENQAIIKDLEELQALVTDFLKKLKPITIDSTRKQQEAFVDNELVPFLQKTEEFNKGLEDVNKVFNKFKDQDTLTNREIEYANEKLSKEKKEDETEQSEEFKALIADIVKYYFNNTISLTERKTLTRNVKKFTEEQKTLLQQNIERFKEEEQDLKGTTQSSLGNPKERTTNAKELLSTEESPDEKFLLDSAEKYNFKRELSPEERKGFLAKIRDFTPEQIEDFKSQMLELEKIAKEKEKVETETDEDIKKRVEASKKLRERNEDFKNQLKMLSQIW